MIRVDISFKKGDTLNINFIVVEDLSGSAIDLTSWKGQTWKVLFSTRNVLKSSDVTDEITLVNPVLGRGTLHLHPVDTRLILDGQTYKMKILSANTDEEYTFLCGTLKDLKYRL